MYKQATKMKLRFDTARGLISVEDLWDLPLTSVNGVSLDGVAKSVNSELKESQEESFVIASTPESSILQLKLDIVKDVIAGRIEERENAELLIQNKAKKEKILSALDRKEDDALEDKTPKQLQKMLEKL